MSKVDHSILDTEAFRIINQKCNDASPSDIPLNTDVTSNVLVKRTTAGSLTSSLLQLKGHWMDLISIQNVQFQK